MTHSKSDQSHAPSRRAVLEAVAIAAAGLPLAATATAARAENPKVMLMFVQMAQDVVIDQAARTLRLVKLQPQTLYFADRPERIAGHIRTADYMKEWTSKAGADNFSKDPPNAALSVYEPDQPNNTLAIIEILNPKLVGEDLVYDFKHIQGTLPKKGGATTIFIDWIGVGGGVGFGFHGVGVGLRGPGVL